MPNPYLASNQPYQRVDDGIGAGFVAGGVVGAAAAGTAHKWGKQGIDAFSQRSSLKTANSLANMLGAKKNLKSGRAAAETITNAHKAQESKHARNMKVASKAEGLHNKAFGGGWKGKAIAYGGSVLAGGILGAGVDAMSD
ncbi:hypothetical protein BN2127_JRS10_00124 [Bacillus subtilis]|nr:hypothetical protein BN2127_JRS10_00124 [Bacillus subtilis]